MTVMYNTQFVFFFFFQAEDGIRDYKVTGVQTCALPIWKFSKSYLNQSPDNASAHFIQKTIALDDYCNELSITFEVAPPEGAGRRGFVKIGRASCRERV